MTSDHGEINIRSLLEDSKRSSDEVQLKQQGFEAELSKLFTSLHADRSGFNESKTSEENQLASFSTEFSLIIALLDQCTSPFSEPILLQQSKFEKMGLLGNNLIQIERLVREVLENRCIICGLREELENSHSKERQHELEISAYLDQINLLKNIISSNRARLLEIDLELDRYQVERCEMTESKINLEREISRLKHSVDVFNSNCSSLFSSMNEKRIYEKKTPPFCHLEDLGSLGPTLQQVEHLVSEILDSRLSIRTMQSEATLLQTEEKSSADTRDTEIANMKKQLIDMKETYDSEMVRWQQINENLQRDLNEHITSALRITSEYSERVTTNEKEYSEALCIARQELNTVRCKVDIIQTEKSILESEVTRLSVLVQKEVGEKVDLFLEQEILRATATALKQECDFLKTTMLSQKSLLENEITRLAALVEADGGDGIQDKVEAQKPSDDSPVSFLESLVAIPETCKNPCCQAVVSELSTMKLTNRSLQLENETLKLENVLKSKELTTLQVNYIVFFMIGALGWLV